VSEHRLEIAHEGPVLERVGGVRVSQVVRGDTLQTTLAGSLSDGFLHIGLVAAPSDLLCGAGMATGGEGGEQPGPAFGQTGGRVLPVQQAG